MFRFQRETFSFSSAEGSRAWKRTKKSGVQHLQIHNSHRDLTRQAPPPVSFCFRLEQFAASRCTMPVGEVPLTSYFTRVPQEKKRKENPSPTNSAPAKRKRLNDDGEQVRAVKKKETKQVSLAFPKAKDTRKTAPVRTSGGSHHEARFPALESPVVLDPVPDKRPTPPSPASTTTIATGDLIDFTTDSPPLSSSQNTSPCSRNPLPQTPRIEQDDIRKVKSLALAHNNDASCRTEARDDDDPSSSFVPSSQTQDISSPNPLNSSLPSLPEHSESRTLAPPSPFDASQWDDSIPSSQSQYILPIQSSPGHEGEISDIDFVPSSQSQYITPTPTAIQRDEDGFVVPSSQSQWLPPFHSYGEVEEDMAADDEVPSSQSQFELELKPASFCHRRAR